MRYTIRCPGTVVIHLRDTSGRSARVQVTNDWTVPLTDLAVMRTGWLQCITFATYPLARCSIWDIILPVDLDLWRPV
jgi:hypothetical protein